MSTSRRLKDNYNYVKRYLVLLSLVKSRWVYGLSKIGLLKRGKKSTKLMNVNVEDNEISFYCGFNFPKEF